MSKKIFQFVLERLLTEARRVYGERLVAFGVFGSVGRGTPNPFSDVDVLLVAEDLPRGRLARVDEFVREDEAMSAALGARRIRRGNFWYWDLKPDYTPGGVIEL